MVDWQDRVERPRLVCAASGRAIAPGERFYSALRLRDGRFVREDYAEEAWTAEHAAEAVSWWRQRRGEEREDQRPRLVNHAVLAAIFNDVKDATERPQQCFAWLLALLLTRAKRFRYLDLVHDDDGDWLVVEERGTKVAHRIRDPGMTAEEEERVQRDLDAVFTMPAGDGRAGEGGDETQERAPARRSTDAG